MDRFDPFVKYADVYGDIINWEKDPMNKPQNQNKYFFSDGKTYYEQICKMLRLMSVFKEAFNQIYNNEDEISEAWENFVNNLSASVVEGSEPDVTLTWTDDSVNFEFTMVPGVPGDPGVGIASISFNSDYTMTITLSDGTTYTSMSLKGDTGPQGPQGETGSGLQILDVYATLADLQSAHPTGQPGDAYQVGSGGNYILYIWSSSQSAWVPAGSLGTVPPSTSNPLMNGTASAGSSDLYSRGDHVHPSDTSRASQEELDALIRTSQALIDQSFTYRESPAIQDGLAKIKSIKGNTLVWNQIVENGNFVNTSGWTGVNGGAISVANNEATISLGASTGSDVRTMCSMVKTHKYILIVSIKTDGNILVAVAGVDPIYFTNSSYETKSNIFTWGANTGSWALQIRNNTSEVRSVNAKNIMLIDLTLMFGAGNEPTSVDEFTSLFPLPYYTYNTGTLLNFNGTGIKTVGFNQWDEEWEVGFIDPSTGLPVSNSTRFRSKNFTSLFQRQYYIYCGQNEETYIFWYDGSQNYINRQLLRNTLFTPPTGAMYFKIGVVGHSAYENDICINFSDTSKNGTYEPYTTNTTNLPKTDYYPTGLKSAGSVYDELTLRKAEIKVGTVDLGSLEYVYDSTVPRFYTSGLANIIKKPSTSDIKGNAISGMYEVLTANQFFASSKDKSMMIATNGNISFINTTYSSASAFKSAMSGVYLNYELATPVETSVDLDLDFKAYENGTEQLLPVNGAVPSTSPIIADMTYLSIDDAMEYIIDKLANVPQNTQQILDALEDDVDDLQEDVGALQPAVSALQTSVGNINTNIGQISSTVAGHTSSISDMQSDITDLNTGLNDLEDTVSNNTSRIGMLETDLSTTDGQVQNLETSVSELGDTVTAQGTTVTALDDIISDISNNPVNNALGNHELGFVSASAEATLPANTGTMVTIPKPTIFPNNYTPLFIAGMTTGSDNVSICSIPNTFGTGNSVTCRVWNHGSQQTTQISVYILCMRQKQSQ